MLKTSLLSAPVMRAAVFLRTLAAACLLLALSSIAAVAADSATIRNYWRQTLLLDDGGQPGLGKGGDAAVWEMEPTNIGGSVRLRGADGGYLHLENDPENPEIGAVGPGWQSAMWVLEPVPGTDLVRIRNLWRKNYLHIEHGPVKAGAVGPGWFSARWKVTQVAAEPPAPPPPPSRGVTSVPLGGNAFLSNYGTGGAKITNDGLIDWSDARVVTTTYVRVMAPGKRKIALVARSRRPATIEVTVGGKRITGTIEGRDWARYELGTFALGEGYLPIAVRGLEKEGGLFPDIHAVEIAGEPEDFRFVSDSTETRWGKSPFYWGRRGPSTHLYYIFPDKVDIEWFYSEITVPRGSDVPGSYYEATGSAESYAGFQVVGDDARKLVFSVWASYKVMDPKDLPPDQRIRLEAKGPGVDAGDFGNEGTGGSSSVIFPWKTGQPYGFLTRIRPNADGSTSYSAWFHDTKAREWHFLASFRRPQTNTWYQFPYAFLENFYADRGAVERRAFYGNQWAVDRHGTWHEITSAKFGVDATGAAEARMDFHGGVAKGQFMLRGFGFFDDYTQRDVVLTRKATGRPPRIDFDRLPWGDD